MTRSCFDSANFPRVEVVSLVNRFVPQVSRESSGRQVEFETSELSVVDVRILVQSVTCGEVLGPIKTSEEAVSSESLLEILEKVMLSRVCRKRK